jgi:2-aminoadipate transaminase
MQPPDIVRRSHETRLDTYVNRYATRTKGMTASEIRALFAVAARPEVVSLAGGMPNISGLPLDAVAESLHSLIVERGTTAMQYGSGQGDPVLREQICDVMRLEGINADADDVVVTVGSQQAVDLVTRIFCDPGDVVLCEAPSYVGALGVFRAYECDVVHVEMDDRGLVPAALQNAIAMVRGSGRRLKFLYTIPNHHNPAGVSLSVERRKEVVEICQRADLMILEDNPYGLLGFDDDPFRALRADHPNGVVYLGSFSKTFAPGFRVGWALAPHAVREKLVLAQESATLCPPAFSQLAVSTYLTNHDWLGQLKSFREMYRERRDTMLEGMAEVMPASAAWSRPSGGFYIWLTLPDGLNAKAMLPRAVTSRVAYVPGTAFFADGFGSRSMRLSYCYPPPERIREGVQRLGAVIEQELELQATFGTSRQAISRGYDTPNTDLA